MVLTRKQAFLAAAGVLVFVGVSIAVQQAVAQFVDFQAEDIQEWVDQFGVFGPLVYIAALALSIIFSPLPTAALAVAAGLAWGTLLGALYTMVGGTIGGVSCFWLARRFGRPFVAKRVNPSTVEYIDNIANVLGARLIFLMRIVPVFGFEWVSYAAGLTTMRLSTFTIWSILGSIPPVFAITYAGASLDEDPVKAAIVVGILVAVALLTLAYFAFRRQPALSATIRRARSHPHAITPHDDEPPA